MYEKDLGITEYLDLYGNILDERQLQIMDMYFNEDYSLSEISEITGITRQGVRDSIQKSSLKLHDIDEKLQLKDRIEAFEKCRDTIASQLSEILGSDDKTIELIDKLKNLTV